MSTIYENEKTVNVQKSKVLKISYTVFPLINNPGAYLIPKHEHVALIKGQRLREIKRYYKRNYSYEISERSNCLFPKSIK